MDIWATVELMGHIRMAGKLTEEEHFGSKLGRLDIPNKEGGFTTQFFSGGSVYRITPVSEEVARAVALQSDNAPIQQWELPKQIPAPAVFERAEKYDVHEQSDWDDEEDDTE